MSYHRRRLHNSDKTSSSRTRTSDRHSSRRRGSFSRINGIFIAIAVPVILMLFIVIGTTAYKAIAINHSGIYASNKLIRSKDYGLCMLITYKPEYQTNIAKGFVITNIPNKEFFSKRLRSNFSSYSIADSEDMLNVYKVMASVSDNKILDSVFDIMSLAVDFYGNRFINGLFDYVSDSYQSIKSVELGKYGKYFVISSSDIEKDKPYY